jgi:uncharacterized membrane protein YhaH (DUF805 family)
MRLGQAAFWRLLIINLSAVAVLVAILPASFSLPRPPFSPLPLWPIIALLLSLPVGWLGAKRLHDVGQRGWHAWLPLFAFACATIVPSAVPPLLPSLALWAQNARHISHITEISMAAVLGLWLGALLLAAGTLRTVFLWLKPGDAGDNRYGPPPLETDAPTAQPPAQGWFLAGRMQRLPFWLIMVANTALVYGVKYALTYWPGGGHLGLLSWISAYLYLPSFAAAVLRLHDRGQSGALAMLVFVISAAAPVAEMFLDRSQTNWMNVAIDILCFYLLFQCWQPGDSEENRHGPPPGNTFTSAATLPVHSAVAHRKAVATSAVKPDTRQGFGRRAG